MNLNKQLLLDRIWKKPKCSINPEEISNSNAKTQTSLHHDQPDKDILHFFDNFHLMAKVHYQTTKKSSKPIKRNLIPELKQIEKSSIKKRVSTQISDAVAKRVIKPAKNEEKRKLRNSKIYLQPSYCSRPKEGQIKKNLSCRSYHSIAIEKKQHNNRQNSSRCANSLRREVSSISLRNKSDQSEQKLRVIRKQLNEIYNMRKIQKVPSYQKLLIKRNQF